MLAGRSETIKKPEWSHVAGLLPSHQPAAACCCGEAAEPFHSTAEGERRPVEVGQHLEEVDLNRQEVVRSPALHRAAVSVLMWTDHHRYSLTHEQRKHPVSPFRSGHFNRVHSSTCSCYCSSGESGNLVGPAPCITSGGRPVTGPAH
ncbi:hypothetical protein VZT92_001190 [Zoarces viviparus]